MTLSYNFNGTVETGYQAWREWVSDALALGRMLGYEPNYYDATIITPKETDFGRLSRIGGIQRKISNAEKKGNEITRISFYVLPDDFSSAAFDYKLDISRGKELYKPGEDYVTLTFNGEFEPPVDETTIISLLRKNIMASSGEVFEMEAYEVPAWYASKSKGEKELKTLKIIKSLM